MRRYRQPASTSAVQNAAARLVTGVRRRDHITPVLRQLHWLPVRQRVNFKLAVLVYQALRNTMAQYLVELRSEQESIKYFGKK